MDESIQKKAEQYLSVEQNSRFRKEVTKLIEQNDEAELYDRFYTELAFGTGGLRGVMGGGMNRMNTYIVQRATRGLAQYAKQELGNIRIAIAYDSRHNSRQFAMDAALVCAELGIQVMLFREPRPTPMLSFAVRTLDCGCGIVVTASHNPPAYNGYKVYWNDGSQIVAPQDAGIIDTVRTVKGVIPSLDEGAAREKNLLVDLGEDMDTQFQRAVLSACTSKASLRCRVVYTPLHGTGASLMEPVLGAQGVDFYTVKEQRDPQGDFPTVSSPNPEDPSSLEYALREAKERRSDVLLATDPDADRIGVGVRHRDEIRLISGNQLGVLVGDYLFSQRKWQGTLPSRPVFVNTVVTTDLQRKIVESYGGRVVATLTGFKHIAAVMRELEQEGQLEQFIMGTEESFGLLIGTHVRDKDGITAAAVITEMVAHYLAQGKTLIERLEELYATHGYYEELTVSRIFRGAEGMHTMSRVMDRVRHEQDHLFAGETLVSAIDFLDQKIYRSGKEEALEGFPPSNVLKFVFDDESWVVIRPSGTEPKLKMYFSFHDSLAGKTLAQCSEVVSRRIERVRTEFEKNISAFAEA